MADCNHFFLGFDPELCGVRCVKCGFFLTDREIAYRGTLIITKTWRHELLNEAASWPPRWVREAWGLPLA